MPKYRHFFQDATKVSPLAVLNKCRQNYAEKTWDSGIFAYFNSDIKDNVLKVAHGSVSSVANTGAGANTGEIICMVT